MIRITLGSADPMISWSALEPSVVCQADMDGGRRGALSPASALASGSDKNTSLVLALGRDDPVPDRSTVQGK